MKTEASSQNVRWNDTDILNFLSVYERHECLWNTQNYLYKNKAQREKACENIIAELNIGDFSVQDIKNKIKSVRTAYMAEISKIKNSTKHGDEDIYQPRLRWFAKADSFLRSVSHVRKVKHNINNVVYEVDDDNDSYEEVTIGSTNDTNFTNNHEEHSTDTTNNLHQQSSSTSTYVESMYPLKKSKMSVTTGRTIQATSMNNVKPTVRNKSSLQSVLNHSPVYDGDNENEFDIFGRSVACQLRKMPLDAALQTQLKIQQILTEERVNIILAIRDSNEMDEMLVNHCQSSSNAIKIETEEMGHASSIHRYD